MSASNDNTVKAALLRGVPWTSAARITSEVTAVGALVALARLIPPADFGKAVAAIAIANIGAGLALQSFAMDLVQRTTLASRHTRAAMLLNGLIGGIMTAAVVAVGLVLEPVLGEDASKLVAVVAPVFLLAGLSAVPRALLQRDLKYKELGVVEVVSLVAGSFTAIAGAVAGLNALSLVLGALGVRLIYLAATWCYRPPPRPTWNTRAIGEILHFGGPASLGGLVHTTFQNIDYAIAGGRLDATSTALYYRAYQFGVTYQSKVSRILLEMAFPAYSRLSSKDQVRNLRARITRVHAVTLFPVLALYVFAAPTLVPALLGNRWADAVEPSQYLAVAGVVSVVLTGTGPLVLGLGRPRSLLAWELSQLLIYGPLVYIAAPFGVVALAKVVALFFLLQLMMIHPALLTPVAGVRIRDTATEVAPPTIATTALVAATLLTADVLGSLGLSPGSSGVLAGALGLGTYTAVLKLAFPGTWADLRLLANRLVPRCGSRRGGANSRGRAAS